MPAYCYEENLANIKHAKQPQKKKRNKKTYNTQPLYCYRKRDFTRACMIDVRDNRKRLYKGIRDCQGRNGKWDCKQVWKEDVIRQLPLTVISLQFLQL